MLCENQKIFSCYKTRCFVRAGGSLFIVVPVLKAQSKVLFRMKIRIVSDVHSLVWLVRAV